MSSQTREKIIAFFLMVFIIGLGAASLWMWKISEPVLSLEGDLGTPQTPIVQPVEGSYTVSMKIPNFTLKDESYSEIILLNDDYIIPYSNTGYLYESDLMGLNAMQLRVARNEIYARHGRMYETPELKASSKVKTGIFPCTRQINFQTIF